MPFENLTSRISSAFKNIIGKGKLSERNMDSMLQEIRLALLEADVSFNVVDEFLNNVKNNAIGQKVYDKVNPDQMVVKIVNDELVKLLGEKEATISYKMGDITTIMFVGLQGTGKTTNLAKMANNAKLKNNRRPLIIAADVIRPAAIEQLQTLGQTINVEVFTLGSNVSALETVKKGMIYAKENNYDTVFIDTAGRLHIDDELMHELADIKKLVRPEEILLTVDAMTGQDIVNVAQSFNDQLSITGLVVTKFDGDSKGGGIVSVRAVTGVPVKFVGTGEKIDDFELFYPDRVAQRILGMGDIVSLVEKAEEELDIAQQEKTLKKMMSGEFDLDDMAYELKQITKMGSLKGLIGMLPGFNQYSNMINDEEASNNNKKIQAIISSMTKEERKNPDIIRASRKYRIANGSGTSVTDVNRLLSQFEKMRDNMKKAGRINGGNLFKF